MRYIMTEEINEKLKEFDKFKIDNLPEMLKKDICQISIRDKLNFCGCWWQNSNMIHKNLHTMVQHYLQCNNISYSRHPRLCMAHLP